MHVSEQVLGRRMERFQEAARESGLKLTHQRLEIFREVASTEDHPDAETIYEGVRTRVPTVSLDTVYRTLWLLEDLGLLTTLGPRRERARFDANLDSHHHFVCECCGLVRDFDHAGLDALDVLGDVEELESVSRVSVEVRGVCRECARRGNGDHVKNGSAA
jgi:Fur family peroxide stress response transcriptional regulator